MKLFSIDFWVSAFVSTMITMVCIFAIKKLNAKFSLPLVSTVVEGV